MDETSSKDESSVIIESESNDMFSSPKIVMVVLLLKLNKSKIDLDTLARNTLNAHYKKKRFAACIIRCPKGVGLFFSSGTVVLSFGDIRFRDYLESLYIEKLRVFDPELSIVSSKIQNTTVTCKVKSKIYLNRLRASQEQKDVKFEAELFPGLNRRITVGENSKIKVIVFGSGTFNITGCKSVDEMREAYKIASAWISGFTKTETNKRKRFK